MTLYYSISITCYNCDMKKVKVLQLNVWTGRIKGALLDFFENNKFDVICLQEAIWSDNQLLESFAASVEQIKEASGLVNESRAANWDIDALGAKVFQGNVILTRERIVNEEIKTVHGKYSTVKSDLDLYEHCYKAQIVTLESGLNILNYHGYWQKDPLGNETTISVMEKVAEMAKKATGPLVMCGDLNITSASPAMRKLDFLKDLTHVYDIDNTLSGLKFLGKVPCDHILVNNSVKVLNFEVEERIVSDHKALTCELEVLD